MWRERRESALYDGGWKGRKTKSALVCARLEKPIKRRAANRSKRATSVPGLLPSSPSSSHQDFTLSTIPRQDSTITSSRWPQLLLQTLNLCCCPTRAAPLAFAISSLSVSAPTWQWRLPRCATDSSDRTSSSTTSKRTSSPAWSSRSPSTGSCPATFLLARCRVCSIPSGSTLTTQRLEMLVYDGQGSFHGLLHSLQISR